MDFHVGVVDKPAKYVAIDFAELAPGAALVTIIAPPVRHSPPIQLSLATRASGPHPFPSRTRSLSLTAPMVLRSRDRGRVGRCRHPLRRPRHTPCAGGVVFSTPPLRLAPRHLIAISCRPGPSHAAFEMLPPSSAVTRLCCRHARASEWPPSTCPTLRARVFAKRRRGAGPT